jgi:hypothetical protein
LNIQLGYDVQLFNANHTIQLSYLTADKTDRYSRSRLGGSFGGFSTDVRMISLTTRLNPSFATTLDYASNDNFTKDYSDFSYNVFGLGAEYTFFNGRLTTFGEIRQTSADQFISEQAIDYSRSLFRMGGVYKFSARQTLSVDINIFSITNKNITNNISKTYRDSIVRLRYEKYF